VRLAWEAAIVTTAPEANRGPARAARAGRLAAWAEASGRRQGTRNAGGRLRFAFYGRVSPQDWQDPVTSRARQREQAEALARTANWTLPAERQPECRPMGATQRTWPTRRRPMPHVVTAGPEPTRNIRLIDLRGRTLLVASRITAS